MNPQGPYVAMAIICEAALLDQDQRITCVRIMDAIHLTIPEDRPAPFPVTFQGNAVISFKSGQFVGSKTLKVELRDPLNNLGKEPKEFPLEFQGNEHGPNLILKLDVAIAEEGLYYFNLFLDGELVTRMPLRVKVTRTPRPETEPEN